MSDQANELIARADIFLEHAPHCARDRKGILLLDSPHLHAEVLRFNHHAHAFWVEGIRKALGDLLGQPFLDLEPVGEHVHNAWDFAQADEFPVRDIPHMRLAEKGEQMMFAQAVELDVAHAHHFIIILLKNGAIDDGIGGGAIPLCEEFIHGSYAVGRFSESFALRVLPYTLQNFPDQIFHEIFSLHLRNMALVPGD